MKNFNNPLAFTSITDFLAAILNVVIIIAVPIIVFFLIFAGFLYVTAAGNPEQIKKSSQALMYGMIGGVVILGAVAILNIVQNLVSAF